MTDYGYAIDPRPAELHAGPVLGVAGQQAVPPAESGEPADERAYSGISRAIKRLA